MSPAPEAPTDEMDSLYAGSMEGGEQKPTTDEQTTEDMGSTAVVPIKVLQSAKGEPVKEGDEIMVVVKSVHGEEAVISYAPAKPEGEEGGEGEEAGAETPPGAGEEAGAGEGGMSPDQEIESLNRY
jgi:hypothetical protein